MHSDSSYRFSDSEEQVKQHNKRNKKKKKVNKLTSKGKITLDSLVIFEEEYGGSDDTKVKIPKKLE